MTFNTGGRSLFTAARTSSPRFAPAAPRRPLALFGDVYFAWRSSASGPAAGARLKELLTSKEMNTTNPTRGRW